MPEIETTPETPKWVHPLHDKKVSGNKLDWVVWKAEWARVSNFQSLMNLLHIGFDTELRSSPRDWEEPRPEDWRDRLIFYLEVAYGGRGFLYAEEKRYSSEKSCKKALTEKAFSMLCQKIFNGKASISGYSMAAPEWSHEIVDSDILPKVLWFFLDRSNISLSKDEHNTLIARQFLFNLARMGWMDFDRESMFHPTPEQRQLLEKHKPDFLEILWRLGELDFLVEVRKKVTPQDLVYLRRLVFTDAFSGDRNKYKTIEEALVHEFGNRSVQAAETLILLRIMAREENRQRLEQKVALKRHTEAEDALIAASKRIEEIEKAILAAENLDEVARLRVERESLNSELPALRRNLKEAKKQGSAIIKHYRGF